MAIVAGAKAAVIVMAAIARELYYQSCQKSIQNKIYLATITEIIIRLLLL